MCCGRLGVISRAARDALTRHQRGQAGAPVPREARLLTPGARCLGRDGCGSRRRHGVPGRSLVWPRSPAASPLALCGNVLSLVRSSRGGILHVVLARLRPDRPQLGAMEIVSASEHLIVEQPLTPRSRRRSRWVLAACILLVCGGAIFLLLENPPEPALGRIAARTPTAWFHRYAYGRHLRLSSMIDYGTSARLQIAVDPGHLRVFWLQERDGLWRALASGDR